MGSGSKGFAFYEERRSQVEEEEGQDCTAVGCTHTQRRYTGYTMDVCFIAFRFPSIDD